MPLSLDPNEPFYEIDATTQAQNVAMIAGFAATIACGMIACGPVFGLATSIGNQLGDFWEHVFMIGSGVVGIVAVIAAGWWGYQNAIPFVACWDRIVAGSWARHSERVLRRHPNQEVIRELSAYRENLLAQPVLSPEGTALLQRIETLEAGFRARTQQPNFAPVVNMGAITDRVSWLECQFAADMSREELS